MTTELGGAHFLDYLRELATLEICLYCRASWPTKPSVRVGLRACSSCCRHRRMPLSQASEDLLQALRASGAETKFLGPHLFTPVRSPRRSLPPVFPSLIRILISVKLNEVLSLVALRVVGPKLLITVRPMRPLSHPSLLQSR